MRLLLKKASVWTWDDNDHQEIEETHHKCSYFWTSMIRIYQLLYWTTSLNSAQRNYTQIERELVKMVLECDKFHFCLCGRPFVALTDHKILFELTSKPLNSLWSRLVIRLMKYDVTLTFIPGKEVYILAVKMLDLLESTNSDPKHQIVKDYTYHGWPIT